MQAAAKLGGGGAAAARKRTAAVSPPEPKDWPRVPKGALLLGCRRCDYDLCPACFRDLATPHVSAAWPLTWLMISYLLPSLVNYLVGYLVT